MPIGPTKLQRCTVEVLWNSQSIEVMLRSNCLCPLSSVWNCVDDSFKSLFHFGAWSSHLPLKLVRVKSAHHHSWCRIRPLITLGNSNSLLGDEMVAYQPYLVMVISLHVCLKMPSYRSCFVKTRKISVSARLPASPTIHFMQQRMAPACFQFVP